jgi:hypothetical protein
MVNLNDINQSLIKDGIELLSISVNSEKFFNSDGICMAYSVVAKLPDVKMTFQIQSNRTLQYSDLVENIKREIVELHFEQQSRFY